MSRNCAETVPDCIEIVSGLYRDCIGIVSGLRYLFLSSRQLSVGGAGHNALFDCFGDLEGH